MSRNRSTTPAARLRDAALTAGRRRSRMVRGVLAGYFALGLAALVGLAVTAPGANLSGEVDPQARSAGAGAAHPDGAPSPDRRVEDLDWSPRPLPPGWANVAPLLDAAVVDAANEGHEMAVCLLAIDSPDELRVCSGDDEPRYAASVIKVAYAIGALEAWDGDPEAETPFGALDELLEQAITVSDNDAANLLYELSVEGPTAPEADTPIAALNAIADRVGLADEFHTGGAFTYEFTGDWSRISAGGSVEYLNELVRAADGRAPGGRSLTSPEIAREVLGLMLRQERQWKLPGRLPAGTAANKTGETDTESHDIAVINTASGRYALAVIGSTSGIFTAADDVMADLGYDVARALGGAARF
ncbi:serine hydrolase [Dietzia alimentaria]|uniref:serine hydrolase n=1 Tax=Dietzia alimentaria TaxID=665550 RepID=UPI0003095382|nr:serine hydrolase [Dietzia alimentaria]